MLGTLAFGAAGASANPAADRAVCAFTGAAGPLVPNIPQGPADVDGAYGFTGNATCVVVEKSAGSHDVGASNGVYNVGVNSGGFYTSTACGTGNVNGTAALWQTGVVAGGPASEFGTGTPPGTNPTLTASTPTWYSPFDTHNGTAATGGLAGNWTAADYGIDFVNGVGTLGGSAVSPGAGTPSPTDIDAWNVTGSVAITPQPAGPPPAPTGCVNTPATGFSVNGAFTAES
jgi:hypothetical protein